MIRAALCLAILLLGKKLRRNPKFSNLADPGAHSYLVLHGCEDTKPVGPLALEADRGLPHASDVQP